MRPEFRDPEPRDWVVILGAIAWGLAFVGFIWIATGCGNPQVKSACIVEADSGMCWVVKKAKQGRPLTEMEGEFCINMQDTARLIRRLNECENGDRLAVVSTEFKSLCVIEAKAGMCWVHKPDKGRAFADMEANNCVDRVDLDRIISRLNQCKAERFLDYLAAEIPQPVPQLQLAPRLVFQPTEP